MLLSSYCLSVGDFASLFALMFIFYVKMLEIRKLLERGYVTIVAFFIISFWLPLIFGI